MEFLCSRVVYIDRFQLIGGNVGLGFTIEEPAVLFHNGFVKDVFFGIHRRHLAARFGKRIDDCYAKAGFWGWLPYVPAKDAINWTYGEDSGVQDGEIWWPAIKFNDPLVYYNTWGNLLPIGAWTNSGLGYKVFERTPNFTGAPGVLNDGNPVHNAQIGNAFYELSLQIFYHRQIFMELRDGATWDEGDGVKIKINLDWTPG